MFIKILTKTINKKVHYYASLSSLMSIADTSGISIDELLYGNNLLTSLIISWISSC